MSDTVRSGEVKITLVDEEVVLKPSGRALRALIRKYGGLNAVIQALGGMNDDVMADIIAAGTNATQEQRKSLPDAVYAQGMIELLPPLTRFVMILGNGGREPEDDVAPDEERADPNVA